VSIGLSVAIVVFLIRESGLTAEVFYAQSGTPLPFDVFECPLNGPSSSTPAACADTVAM